MKLPPPIPTPRRLPPPPIPTPAKKKPGLFDYDEQPIDTYPLAGCKLFQVGDVIIHGGEEIVCDRVNDSAARFRKRKDLNDFIRLSPQYEIGLVLRRLLPDELIDFLTKRQEKTTTTIDEKGNIIMAKKVAKAELCSLKGRSTWMVGIIAAGIPDTKTGRETVWEKHQRKYPGWGADVGYRNAVEASFKRANKPAAANKPAKSAKGKKAAPPVPAKKGAKKAPAPPAKKASVAKVPPVPPVPAPVAAPEPPAVAGVTKTPAA